MSKLNIDGHSAVTVVEVFAVLFLIFMYAALPFIRTL